MTEPVQPTPPPADWEPTNPPAPAAPRKSWFARHKILTAILALVVIGGLANALGGGDDEAPDRPATAASEPASGESAPADEPAGEPAAEPTKESAPGIGSTVRDGKFEFVVNSVADGGKEVGSQYVSEKAQGVFTLINITVTNIGDKPQTLFDSNQEVVDDQGRKFSPNSMAAIVLEGNSDVWLTEINPGNTITGTLVYDMPEGATPVQITLHDSMLSRGVKVALQ